METKYNSHINNLEIEDLCAKLIDKSYKSPKINLVLILFCSSVLECCLDLHKKCSLKTYLF